jgi:alpha-beta hydrolase superfamily lysophospholipase
MKLNKIALRCGLLASAITMSVNSVPVLAQAYPGVHIEVLALRADPPGAMRAAPGGGRELTPALLFTPAAGENRRSPAIVMLTEGPGSNPVSSETPARWAAERLAKQGYTVLSLYAHMERGFVFTKMEESAVDVKAAIDLLEQNGHEQIILMGHGYGAVVAAEYIKNYPDDSAGVTDAKRVQAAVFFSPLTELKNYRYANLNHNYDAKVAQARVSVANGRGLIPKKIEVGKVGNVETDDKWIATGLYVAPAESFLNWWGPEAQTRNMDLLAHTNVPTLYLGGGKDAIVSIAALKQFKAAAPNHELITYPAGDFEYTGLREKAVEDVVSFLDKQGLGVKPNIEEIPTNVRATDGQMLNGVIYQPVGGTPKDKPAFIMLHGLSEDIIHSSTHWLGWRLAQQGYTALAISTHASGAVGAMAQGTYPQLASDIKQWVDQLSAQGYTRIILTGHSMGGFAIANYLGSTEDKRIIGAVYIGSTGLRNRLNGLATSDPALYAKRTAEAQALLKKGDNETVLDGTVFAIPSKFLDGPHKGDNFYEYTVPSLLVGGSEDSAVRPEMLDSFTKGHTGPTKVIIYPGASHGLKESKELIRRDIDQWVQASFMQK